MTVGAYACAYLASTPADGGDPAGRFRPGVISRLGVWPSGGGGLASFPEDLAPGRQPRPGPEPQTAAHQRSPCRRFQNRGGWRGHREWTWRGW